VKLAIIAAVGRNRVIGKGGALPWHIPEDLKRFKRLTTGHPVLMGRKTYESIGRQLPNRRNIVVSSRPIPGVETFSTVDDALTVLRDEEVVFVIGGAQVYAQVLDRADELHLTLVDQTVDGDAFFPEYEHLIGSRFVLRDREDYEGYSFVTYVRRS
jgi:dihydrofolate reductase